MCTVTFFPKNGTDFILTTNRDEDPKRSNLAPDFYGINDVRALYPKDERSGGTWIGVSEKNRLVCVLNGAFEKHERQPEYRKSRGLIALDFLYTDRLEHDMGHYSLENIEPFTMILVDWNITLDCIELVWDGNKKHMTHVPLVPKIWSSSPLYTPEMKTERDQWFKHFKSNKPLTATSILKFHKTAGSDTKGYGVIMDRGFVKTTSITQVKKTADVVYMHYESLQQNTSSDNALKLAQTIDD